MSAAHDQWESLKVVASGLGGAAGIIRGIDGLAKFTVKHKRLETENQALRAEVTGCRRRIAELERFQREYKATLSRVRMSQAQDDDPGETFPGVTFLKDRE